MPAQRHVVSSAVVVADQGGDGRIEVGRHIVGDLVDVPLDGLVITLQLAVGLRMDLSVAAQLRALRDYSRKNDYMVVRESVDEAESKRIACRPEFNKMIDEARMPKATFREILVWEFPRFAHKREHAASYKSMLGRKGVRVVSIAEHADDTPTGKLMEPIVESVHEFYSENLAQEVWRGLRRGRLERSWNASGPPSRDRRTHLATAARETRNRRATSAWGQPASILATNSARVTGVKRALEWLMRGLLSLVGCVHHNGFSQAPHLPTASMRTTPNALDRRIGHLWIRGHGYRQRRDCRLGPRGNCSARPQSAVSGS